ncbi:MAG: hypothetical protein AABW89_01990 [Nanoarchaeota archaeon]
MENRKNDNSKESKLAVITGLLLGGSLGLDHSHRMYVLMEKAGVYEPENYAEYLKSSFSATTGTLALITAGFYLGAKLGIYLSKRLKRRS